MRKLVFLFTVFLIVSCATETELASTDDDATQSNIITTLKNIAQSNYTTDFVKYDLTIDENGNISIANRRIIKRTKHSETYLGFQKKTNSLTIKLDDDTRGAGIQVCCTLDGETYDCDTCVAGPGQTLCVAKLVIDSVEAGGCSVTCNLPIIFDSLKNEFYILK